MLSNTDSYNRPGRFCALNGRLRSPLLNFVPLFYVLINCHH
jgi:hypothetical protein